MALNIKNDEAQRLARELADLTGLSLTAAVTLALREQIERVRASRETVGRRADRIIELGSQIAAALESHPMSVEDLYDERGLPA